MTSQTLVAVKYNVTSENQSSHLWLYSGFSINLNLGYKCILCSCISSKLYDPNTYRFMYYICIMLQLIIHIIIVWGFKGSFGFWYSSRKISILAPNQCALEVLPTSTSSILLTFFFVSLFELNGWLPFLKRCWLFFGPAFCCIVDNFLNVCSLTFSCLYSV